MSDDTKGTMPQTSGAAARGTEAGGGGQPEHLPDSEVVDGERVNRAQKDMADAGLSKPIEGEGTTEEGRENALETAAGPETEAAPMATSSRGPEQGEPDPGAVTGD